MNPILVWQLFSYRKELKYVATVFFLVLLLPVIAVLFITKAGIDVVSDALVTVNSNTLAVEIRNPLDGNITLSLDGPFLWPIIGRIRLEFGESNLPYQPLHTGIDIAGKSGDPIVAFMSGKVIYADEISWGYGKHIVLDNGNNITSVYAHLSKIYVEKGQEVSQGKLIGARGSTGWSTGPHLHFETRVYGIPVNPLVFLQ